MEVLSQAQDDGCVSPFALSLSKGIARRPGHFDRLSANGLFATCVISGRHRQIGEKRIVTVIWGLLHLSP